MQVVLSALEIYKEQVKDLLGDEVKSYSRTARVVVTERPIDSTAEGLQLIDSTKRHRMIAKTLMNQASSRSHLVISLHIKSQYTNAASNEAMVRAATITIVDLAGSENLSQSGSNTGQQRAEAIKINQSLRALTHFLSLVGKAGQKSRRAGKTGTVDPRVVMRNSALTQMLFPRICSDKGKVNNFVVFFICAHPVHPGKKHDAVTHLHTKNALQQAKMARDIPVEEKTNSVTVAVAVGKLHQKLQNLAQVAQVEGKQYQKKIEALQKQADVLIQDKKQHLEKVAQMEALLKTAQQLITKTLGEEARKLLEVGGAKLDPAVLARVERASRVAQKQRLIADTEFAVLKKDLDKLAKLLSAGVTSNTAQPSRAAIPSRCADVASACQSYAVSFEQLCQQIESQATLIADEVKRLSAKTANKKSKKKKGVVGAASQFARARLRAGGGNQPGVPDKLTRQMAPVGSALKEMVAEQLEVVSAIDPGVLDKITNGLQFFWVPIFTGKAAGLPTMAALPPPRAAVQPPRKLSSTMPPPEVARFGKIAAEVSSNCLIIQQLVSHSDGTTVTTPVTQRIDTLKAFVAQLVELFREAHQLANVAIGADTLSLTRKHQNQSNETNNLASKNATLKADTAAMYDKLETLEKKQSELIDTSEQTRGDLMRELRVARDATRKSEQTVRRLNEKYATALQDLSDVHSKPELAPVSPKPVTLPTDGTDGTGDVGNDGHDLLPVLVNTAALPLSKAVPFKVPTHCTGGSVRQTWERMAAQCQADAANDKTPLYTKREVSRKDPLFNDFSQRLRAAVCTHPTEGYKYWLNLDKILAVTNPASLSRFYTRCSKLHNPAFDGIKMRFHGSQTANIDPICKTGFFMPAAGSGAAYFGDALYSSNDAAKAEWHCRGGNVLLVCRVAIGHFLVVGNNMHVPADHLNASNVLPRFDSAYAPPSTPGTGGFTEYMVYHADQMIPEFIICFTRVRVKESHAFAQGPAIHSTLLNNPVTRRILTAQDVTDLIEDNSDLDAQISNVQSRAKHLQQMLDELWEGGFEGLDGLQKLLDDRRARATEAAEAVRLAEGLAASVGVGAGDVALLNEIAVLQFNMTNVSRALHRLQLASIQPTNLDLLRARLVEVRRKKRRLQSKLAAPSDSSESLRTTAPRKQSTRRKHSTHSHSTPSKSTPRGKPSHSIQRKHSMHSMHSTHGTSSKSPHCGKQSHSTLSKQASRGKATNKSHASAPASSTASTVNNAVSKLANAPKKQSELTSSSDDDF